jgi:hypothetical protein
LDEGAPNQKFSLGSRTWIKFAIWQKSANYLQRFEFFITSPFVWSK